MAVAARTTPISFQTPITKLTRPSKPKSSKPHSNFDGYQPTSVLEIPGAKEFSVEFHTLSKTYNMAGWRVGFVVGNRHVIQGLRTLKTNMDYGIFSAIQTAAETALNQAIASGPKPPAMNKYRAIGTRLFSANICPKILATLSACSSVNSKIWLPCG